MNSKERFYMKVSKSLCGCHEECCLGCIGCLYCMGLYGCILCADCMDCCKDCIECTYVLYGLYSMYTGVLVHKTKTPPLVVDMICYCIQNRILK